MVVYRQRLNRRHGMVGHLYQGRYKTILVQKESCLLELIRCIVLHPLRADMVGRPEDWPWRSYRSMIGEAMVPKWLDVDRLLSQFGSCRKSAIESCCRFVLEGKGLPSPLAQTRHQLLLGDDAFAERHRPENKPGELREVSKIHRRFVAMPLDDYQQRCRDRNKAMTRACLSSAYRCRRLAIISVFTI